MDNDYIIGVDAGGTKVAYGLFRGDTMVDRMQHPTDGGADGPEFSDTIIRTAHELLERNKISMNELRGVGVCMPSFILFDEGYVLMTSAMTNIRDFPMRDYLTERLNVPVILDNDSNAAALAEHRHGSGRGSRHMVYVAVSTGIGSGIIIDGKLFRGSYGWAGECGHMLATPDTGLMCGCGNQGCFMSHASGKFAPAHFPGGGVSDCVQILRAYNENDPRAIKLVEQMAHYIAVCLFNVYQMLNINLFVFGGGLVNFGDALFGKVRTEFDRYNHMPQPVQFRFAELGKDFGVIGASELVKDI